MPLIKRADRMHWSDEPTYQVYGTIVEDGVTKFLIFYGGEWAWVDAAKYAAYKPPYDPYRP